ncbi:hypothetical protein [Bradyrhizobium canariense]|uniref:hypothetical protein n=1 Tax=Bradyrhizobium canariense TaxID=255045 RepID=UPI001B8A5230|nr:hypothetical protein [Bradyrhizobium canariense]MBR0955382.1 hypothetical protein [Bradyrhizobium canariense]
MSAVSTIPVHPEGDHASSRFARRVRMRDVEDSSRKFSSENDSRKVLRRKTFGIDEAAIRRIFYRYRDWWRAGCGHKEFMMEADTDPASSVIK